ncbi:guanine nucleotide-binding protein subunit gamma [Cryptococcus wingfieldii CBS 7118]|uniref:Guanine nucleotide-binding protein subunit gamma n=1 Tax=Cryptococcus wingfieldii CBS 7118 TaxID=1295528 RepID=A0A1E3JZ14_9TREE|nr:guanine nucleotide-binding protein subunit gamma [Cryptococcus wingfieldii CBS 7118]ODO06090.1 guanine nucleotide-binding protein subunit gamma [Cryptococcus wingfieldii CBS 7118]
MSSNGISPANLSRPHKTTMSELKLRRLKEHNTRLREDLARPRVRVSEASVSLIKHCSSTKDPILPSVWGPPGKNEDPYSPPEAGCCTIM